MHELRVIGEGEHGSSGVETDAGVPGGQIRRGISHQIAVDSVVVEIPFVSMVSLYETVQEPCSPVGAGDFVLEEVDNGGVGSLNAEIFEGAGAVSESCEGFVVELVHGGGVKSEVAAYMVIVVAGSSKGDLSTDPVASECGGTNFVLVHEAGDIV